jgi:hypothetical protein
MASAGPPNVAMSSGSVTGRGAVSAANWSGSPSLAKITGSSRMVEGDSEGAGLVAEVVEEVEVRSTGGEGSTLGLTLARVVPAGKCLSVVESFGRLPTVVPEVSSVTRDKSSRRDEVVAASSPPSTAAAFNTPHYLLLHSKYALLNNSVKSYVSHMNAINHRHYLQRDVKCEVFAVAKHHRMCNN